MSANFPAEIILTADAKNVLKEIDKIEKAIAQVNGKFTFGTKTSPRQRAAERAKQKELQTQRAILQVKKREILEETKLLKSYNTRQRRAKFIANQAEKTANAAKREAASVAQIKKARTQKVQGAVAGGVISAAFPILTGGGAAESILGGAGGLLGSLAGPLGSFAGGIGGSALGRLITDAEELSKSLAGLNASLGTVGTTSQITSGDIGKLSTQLGIAKDETVSLIEQFNGLGLAADVAALARDFGPVGGASTAEAIALAVNSEKDALSAIAQLRGILNLETSKELLTILEQQGVEAASLAILQETLKVSKAKTLERSKEVRFADRLKSALSSIRKLAPLALGVPLGGEFKSPGQFAQERVDALNLPDPNGKDRLDTLREFYKQKDRLEDNEKTSKRLDQERQIEQVLAGQLDKVVSRTAIEERSLNAAKARLANESTLVTARFNLFSKLNALELQRAKNAGDTQKVLSIQTKQADLIYQKSILQIQADIKKAEIGALQVRIEFKKLEAAVALKAAKGQLVQQDLDALALQKQAVDLAIEGVNTAKLAAGYNMQTAGAIRQATIEQNKFNAAQKSGAVRGGGGGLSGGATVLGGGTRSIGSSTTESLARALAAAGVTGAFSEAQAGVMLASKRQARVDAYQAATRGTAGYTSRPTDRELARAGFADGGYVSSPTNALIGEGGESEYVIPSSKMQESVRRYSAGARGSAVVSGGNNVAAGGGGGGASYTSENNAYVGGGSNQINVTTGPVIKMNGQNYVSMGDLQRGMSEAVSAAERNMDNRMRRSFSARRGMGS